MKHIKTALCFCCQKGGTGKSTTATTVAAALTKEGKSSVLIDIDQQCNGTSVMLPEPPRHTITEVLSGKISALEAVQSSDFGSILPSAETLRDSSITTPDQLKRIVEALQERFDYVIFDCPPNLGKMTVAALLASNFAIICTTSSPFGYQAAIKTLETVEGVQAKNPGLKVAGILPTMTTRATLTKAYLDSLGTVAAGNKTILFSPVRQGVSVPESQLLHKSIFDYAPRSNQAADYSRFYQELKGRIKKA